MSVITFRPKPQPALPPSDEPMHAQIGWTDDGMVGIELHALVDYIELTPDEALLWAVALHQHSAKAREVK